MNEESKMIGWANMRGRFRDGIKTVYRCGICSRLVWVSKEGENDLISGKMASWSKHFNRGIFCSRDCAKTLDSSLDTLKAIINDEKTWNKDLDKHINRIYEAQGKLSCMWCGKELDITAKSEFFCSESCYKYGEEQRRRIELAKIPMKQVLRNFELPNIKIRKDGTCCEILEDHHNMMKDDPDHLSTDFIKKLSKCECEVRK